MEKKDTSRPEIRNLKKEVIELGFKEEDAKKIMEWVNTIPIRIYGGKDIKVEVKRGAVCVNEHLVEPDELSFNNLPDDLALYYLWDNEKIQNPFDLPDDVKFTNPFSGHVMNKDGETVDMGNETTTHFNIFNCKIQSKLEYKDGLPFKHWKVNDKNEWEETDDISEMLEKYKAEVESVKNRIKE